MADLLTAAATQIKYAANTEGDVSLSHIVRAQGYLARAAAPLLPPTPDDPVIDTEPLSTDPSVAIHQLLAKYGHPTTFNAAGESVSSAPADVLAATPDKGAELALLGYFGVGVDRFPGVDYSLRDQYYTGYGVKPKDPDLNAWADYLSHKA